MKIILYDSSPNGALGWSWAVGSYRPGWTRVGARTWHESIKKLLDAVPPGTRVKELQIWGHGQPGEPMFNGLTAPPMFWNRLTTIVMADSLVWFRSCSVFFGRKGQAFAERMANELGCRVAGHTRIIGPWQSGLCSLSPNGKQPFFAQDGYRWLAEDWRKNTSARREPRTIFCARMAVPEAW